MSTSSFLSQESSSYDLLVIGGGSAGYSAASKAAQSGARVGLIEGAKEMGGLCILRGCMPSKALIESANRNLIASQAEEFGLDITVKAPCFERIMERKRALIKDFSSYRVEQLENGNFELIRGEACFLDAHRIEVKGRGILEAKTILIATGSQVVIPPIDGLKEVGYWTSDDILELEQLPKSIAVLGGGAIAVEMAHFLSGLGVEVTLIQRSGFLLSSMDRECGEALAKSFEERGMRVLCETSIQRVEPCGEQKILYIKHQGDLVEVRVSAILCAFGRRPHIEGLELEKAGVLLDKGKVAINAHMQTNIPHIFGAGDVSSPYDLVHIAVEQGEIAAENALSLIEGKQVKKAIDYRLKLMGVFSEPQVASVGKSQREAEAEGLEVLVASMDFNDFGKGMIHGEKHGFVKLIVDKNSREIVGASAVGPYVTDMIHEIVVAMAFHATAGQLLKIPHYHPTLSEIWTYPAEDLAEE